MNFQDKANHFRPENISGKVLKATYSVLLKDSEIGLSLIMTNTGIPQIHRFSHLTLEKTANSSGPPYQHAVQTAALPQEHALHLTPVSQCSC